jgi:hypothetical protein
MFTFTSCTNGIFSNATFTAFEHMEQVSPLAWSVALENCACKAIVTKVITTTTIIFFILRCLKDYCL